jgi:glycerol-3-phosphate dehydrogenase
MEKVHPEGLDVWAQVYHAAEEEWALTVDDVVRRRTTLGIRGLDTEDVRARISFVLASSGSAMDPDLANRGPDVGPQTINPR